MSVKAWLERYSEDISYYAKQPLIGALRGVVVAGVTNPLDVIKFGVQSSEQGIIKVTCDIWKNKGPLGFFNGLSTQLVITAIKSCVTVLFISLIPNFRKLAGNEATGDVITSGIIATIETVFINNIDNKRIQLISKQKNSEDTFKKFFFDNYFKSRCVGSGVFFKTV
jgi:hypothetical protein